MSHDAERCLMPSGETYYQCQWCPCVFSTVRDLELHMKAGGLLQYDHKRWWKYMTKDIQGSYHPPPATRVSKPVYGERKTSTGALKPGVEYVQLKVIHKWDAFSALDCVPANLSPFCRLDWDEKKQEGLLFIPKTVYETNLDFLRRYVDIESVSKVL